jgi:hypothetical protein
MRILRHRGVPVRSVGRSLVASAALVLALAVTRDPFHSYSDAAVVHAAGAAPYRAVEGWPSIPAGRTIGPVSWIDVGPDGTLYAFRRCLVPCDGGHPKDGDPFGNVWTFTRDGAFRSEWGSDLAKEAHGLYVGPDGSIWTTDVQLHQVKKLRPDATVQMTLGRRGVPGDGPDTFNQPTSVIVGSSGDIFVTDGYGNQRVVKFSADGRFVKAWGSKGSEPGQFRIPHAIAQDSRGRLIVADRCGLAATRCSDGRIEIFDTDGRFIEQWTDLGGGPFSPYSVNVLGDRVYVGDGTNAKVWIVDLATGKAVETIDGVRGIHGMTVAPDGDVYVASISGGIRRYTRKPAVNGQL